MDMTQLVVSVLTIAMSGVVSAIVTFRLGARRDARQLRREKLEETFKAFHGFTNELGQHWVVILRVMDGALAYNDALDIINSRGSTGRTSHYSTLSMLIAIYFPELQPHLDKLHEIRDRANDVISAHKEVYREVGPHPTSAASAIRESVGALGDLEGAFGEAVRAEAHKLNRKLKAAA
jgi:hypothetical protein